MVPLEIESYLMGRKVNLKIFGKKRIAYIFNHSYFLGGGEISFYELIRSINIDFIEPIIIVPASGEIKDKLQLLSYKVIVCPFSPIKYIGLGRPLLHLYNLIGILRNKRVDLIHVNGSRVCFYGGLAGRILGIPVLWHVREALSDCYLYDRLLSALATSIICVSVSAGTKRFNRFKSSIDKKMTIVYNGVDTNKFKPLKKNKDKIRRQFRIKENEIVFGLVGNIIPRKAQDFFLRGIALALEIQPALPIKALIIGRCLDTNYEKKLKAMVLNRKLQNKVIFQGYTPAITAILSGLDVFVLSSKSEGFSRALLEAMSCGLPILASKIGEIEEAVVNKKNAILVEFNAIQKMASAIINLCEDLTLRHEIGIRNRMDAQARFGLASHTRAIETIYQNLLDGRIN